MSLWPLGVALGIAGSVGNNLGNNLVSLGETYALEAEKQERTTQISGSTSPNLGNGGDIGHLSHENSNVEPSGDGDHKPKAAPCCSYACLTDLRTIGVVVIIVFNLLNFVSYGFAAQALLAALESTQFVSNVLFVRFVHKENVSTRTLIGTILIVVGNVVVVYFGPKSFRTFTSDDMIDLYLTNQAYWGYLAITGILWFITTGIYAVYYNARMVHRRLLMWHTFLEPICYSFSAGLVGAQAVLKSRCMALLLQAATIGLKNEFAFWYLWFLLALWICLILYWLSRLFYGLKLYPPVFIIPVIQVFFLLFAIICGGMYFMEFNQFTLIQFIGFSLGVVMILAGVYGLAPPEMKLFIPGDPDKDNKSPFDDLEANAFDADSMPVDESRLVNSMNLEKKMSKQAAKYSSSMDGDLDHAAELREKRKPDLSPRIEGGTFAVAPIVESPAPKAQNDSAPLQDPPATPQQPAAVAAVAAQQSEGQSAPERQPSTPSAINRDDKDLTLESGAPVTPSPLATAAPPSTEKPKSKKRKVTKRPPSVPQGQDLPPVKVPTRSSFDGPSTAAVAAATTTATTAAAAPGADAPQQHQQQPPPQEQER